MYKKYFNIHHTRWCLALLFAAAMFTSCDDFLDVRPSSLPMDLNLPFMEFMVPCKQVLLCMEKTCCGD